jgi:hypothetical protein
MNDADDAIGAVLGAILEHSHEDRLAAYAAVREHPMLRQAETWAREGHPDRFFYALPYPLERTVDGLLRTVAPQNPQARFLLAHFSFLNSHFQKVLQRREGVQCSADKSRNILRQLLQHLLTGKPIRFDPEEPYSFNQPRSVFTTQTEILDFFEALYALYYGEPERYLRIVDSVSWS